MHLGGPVDTDHGLQALLLQLHLGQPRLLHRLSPHQSAGHAPRGVRWPGSGAVAHPRCALALQVSQKHAASRSCCDLADMFCMQDKARSKEEACSQRTENTAPSVRGAYCPHKRWGRPCCACACIERLHTAGWHGHGNSDVNPKAYTCTPLVAALRVNGVFRVLGF